MSCTPVLVQDAFRGRNDDNNEALATWKANENTNWTQAVDTNFRIRLHIQVTNACAAANKTFQLEYSLNSGSFTTVNASSSVVRSSASPNVADAANTTDQMAAGTGTFIGLTAFDEVDGLCGGASLDLAASGHTEVEFCVQIRSADVVNNDQIQLRVSSTNLASWTQTPTITVQEAATPTRGRISFAEFEVPFLATRGRISFAELETPLVPTRGRVSWAEFETPLGATRGRISQAELEVPTAPGDPTRGRISFAELEVPDLLPTRGRISWAEFEAPIAPTRGRVSFAELETPAVPTRGRISFAEFQVPDVGGAADDGHAKRFLLLLDRRRRR